MAATKQVAEVKNALRAWAVGIYLCGLQRQRNAFWRDDVEGGIEGGM